MSRQLQRRKGWKGSGKPVQRSTGKSRRSRRQSLRLETLECRRLLAASDAFGHWSFDAPFVKDAGWGNNDVNVVGSPFPFVDSPRGRAVGIGSIPGIPLEVPIASVPNNLESATVAGWFKADRSDIGGYLFSTGGRGLQLGYTGTSIIATCTTRRIHAPETRTEISSPFEFQDDTWYHLALTYNGEHAKLFVNGQEVGSHALTGELALDDTLVFGSGSSLGFPTVGWMRGQLDDVQMYTRALTTEQIVDIMEMPADLETSETIRVHTAGTPIQIDPAVSLGGDESFLNGWGIGARIVTGGQDGDKLEISPEHFRHTEGNVYYLREGEDLLVGSTGTSTDNIVRVLLNENANYEIATKLARAFTFNTNLEQPDDSIRRIEFELGSKPLGIHFVDDVTIYFSDPTGGKFSIDTTVEPARYIAGEGPILIDPNVEVGINRERFGGGVLEVGFVGETGQPKDILRIKSLPHVFVVNTTVRHIRPGSPSAPVGEVSGGKNGEPLRVEFNENAFAATVQDVARAIAFHGFGSTDESPSRLVRFQLTDDNLTDAANKRIEIGPINDNLAPDISAGDDAPIYKHGEGQISFAQDVEIVDADSADFANGKLTFQFAENSAKEGDQLLLADSDAVTFSDGKVFHINDDQSTEVGSVEASEDLKTIVIQLNESATPAVAEKIARRIQYQNTFEQTSDSDRFVKISVSDGDGGSDSLIRKIEIVPAKLAPLITLSIEELRINEETYPSVLDKEAEVSDADASTGGGVRLTVSFAEQSFREGDRLTPLSNDSVFVQGPDIRFGDETGTIKVASWAFNDQKLTIEFNADSTMSMVQEILRSIAIDTENAELTAGDRFLRIAITDTDNLDDATTLKVTVDGGNDAPVLVTTDDVTPVELGESPTIVGPSMIVNDIDSPDFAGGRLVVSVLEPVAQQGDYLALLSDEKFQVDGQTILILGDEPPPIIGEFHSELTTDTKLVIDLTENANPESVRMLMSRIRFGTTSDVLVDRELRLVEYVVDDGDGGVSKISRALSLFAKPTTMTTA